MGPQLRKPRLAGGARRNTDAPTLFHVTHYKAGSQWLHTIFRRCVRDQIVHPQPNLSQFFEQPIKPGGVYPTLYVTREQFESVELPPRWGRFVVIRDLRDTLVSGYFSLKVSHGEFKVDAVSDLRQRLQELSPEEGLLQMLQQWLPGAAAQIQQSWLEAGERMLKYEDLLDRDTELLERTLIDELEYPVPRGRLRRATESARFEKLTKGRKRGEEDVAAHWRKGVAGDWRNHFTEPLKAAFKESWGDLLIATGYETGNDW